MKETTALNNISRIVDNIDYKRVYIEIETKDDKYILEKEKEKVITGFSNKSD